MSETVVRVQTVDEGAGDGVERVRRTLALADDLRLLGFTVTVSGSLDVVARIDALRADDETDRRRADATSSPAR